MFQVRKENLCVGPNLALLPEDGVDPARGFKIVETRSTSSQKKLKIIVIVLFYMHRKRKITYERQGPPGYLQEPPVHAVSSTIAHRLTSDNAPNEEEMM